MATTTKKATRIGICRKCGDEFNKFPANRLLCAACQSLRDLQFRPGLKRKCEVCEVQFWPSRSTYHRCPDCSVFDPEKPDKYPACSECGKHKRTAPGLANTCISCVSVSAEAQKKYELQLSRRIKSPTSQTVEQPLPTPFVIEDDPEPFVHPAPRTAEEELALVYEQQHARWPTSFNSQLDTFRKKYPSHPIPEDCVYLGPKEV